MDLPDNIDNPNSFRCYNCGKQFKKPSDFQRHKDRKTPCLIREIAPENIKHPNRCIYCNKIFSTPGNLKKHRGKCKIKNGGMQMLHDKVRHEEEMRIMVEENNRKNALLEAKLDLILENFRRLEEENKELRAQTRGNVRGNGNVGPITGDNNTVNAVSNTLNINNYNTPNVEHLKNLEEFAKIFKHEMAGTPMALVEKIWYDPDYPENSALHLVNKKNGELMVVVGGKWITENATNIIPIIRHLVYELTQGMIVNNYDRLINFSNDMVPRFLELNRKDENVIKRDNEEIMQKMIDGRKISQAIVNRSK
jgi:DNA polymerase III delta prime subunit